VIDFHCHLDLYPEPDKIAATAEAAGIYVLSVTTTPKAWRKTSALAKGRRHIRTALGLHPELAHERSNELPLFEALITETRYVGEVGLDGSPDHRAHADAQMRVFDRILATAKEHGGRILTIHSRRAVDEVLAALNRHEMAQSAVLHWFSGTQRQLSDAIALDCWFSVGPAMFRSEKGRRLVGLMPRDRVLTETDGPFARDVKGPLEPADVRTAVDELGKLWSIDYDAALLRLKSNLKSLLALVPDQTNMASVR
jgi:TatD DNase family protein